MARKLINNKKVAVAAAVLMKDGKILIAKRKKEDFLGKKWEFPGGKIEPDETPEQCLERELGEEFGIKTKIGRFICSSQYKYIHIYIKILAYYVSFISGKFDLKAHEEAKWVYPEELDKYDFAEADIPIKEKIKNIKCKNIYDF